MLGAIIGDIVGSVYEFNNVRRKDFRLFLEQSTFTDDSVLTCAVADILMNHKNENNEEIANVLKKWARMYPNRGYGYRFYNWIFQESCLPYGSIGNGAVMRISPCGWLGKNEGEVKEYASLVTNLTHNSKQALIGAEVVSLCIYYLRKGKDKKFIKDFVSNYYDLNLNYESLRKENKFSEITCETVPQAIYCFLISESFEDCLRTTVSIGGDTDTLCAVSCALAEVYYGIPENLKKEALLRLPKSMIKLINQFENEVKFMEVK